MTRRPKRISSTGAEFTPSGPVTTEQVLGAPVSTGAVPLDDEPVITRIAHLDEPITVHSPTPGPVTMTVGWLTDAEAKVIEPAEQPKRTPARAPAQTKTSRGRSGS